MFFCYPKSLCHQTIYLKDSFTGVDGTLLSAHTMDVGPGWTNLDGTNIIQSNQARCTVAPTMGSVKSESGHSDGYIQLDVSYTSSGNGILAGPYLRCTDANNGYRVGFRDTGSFELIKRTAGVQVTLDSTTFTFANGTYQIQVRMSGSTITASLYQSGVLLGGRAITGSNAFNQSTTTHGLQFGDTFTTENIALDNFLMTP